MGIELFRQVMKLVICQDSNTGITTPEPLLLTLQTFFRVVLWDFCGGRLGKASPVCHVFCQAAEPQMSPISGSSLEGGQVYIIYLQGL